MERREMAASDGERLGYAVWRPAGEQRRTIAVIHGIAFNGEPYGSISEDLPLEGTRVAALDLRGHGASGGDRGSLVHYKRIVADIQEWLGWLREESPELPLYVLGESMGSLYGTLFGMAHGGTIDGLILVAPPVMLSMKQILHLDTARTVLSLAIPFREHRVALTGWRLEVGSADEEFINDRRTSELAQASVSVGYITRLSLAIMGLGMVGRVRIDCPVMMAYGSDDKVVSPWGCRRLFSRIMAPDKRLIEVPGARHTVLWDPHRSNFYDGLARWIQEHE
jgi:alpha-beta hydrolase superfamily lysophospholipase